MARSKTMKLFIENLGRNNPVFTQVLGICSTLAVTNNMKNTFIMCAGLVFVTALSNVTLSSMRRIMPNRVRMMVEVLIIATYVIIVDITLKAWLPEISKELGPYVGLIITNCIIMGRAEAYALGNPPGPSFVDGLSSGLGYSYVLMIIAFIRELMGSGSLFGIKVLGDWWVNWSIMVMAPGAFFTLAVLIWIIRTRFLNPKGESSK
jgi:Na+-transporting NADH:ubiquinone oxidoreductase subunit D